jgi:hypothetical protein
MQSVARAERSDSNAAITSRREFRHVFLMLEILRIAKVRVSDGVEEISTIVPEWNGRAGAVPTGLVLFSCLDPALTRWANECRRFAAGSVLGYSIFSFLKKLSSARLAWYEGAKKVGF